MSDLNDMPEFTVNDMAILIAEEYLLHKEAGKNILGILTNEAGLVRQKIEEKSEKYQAIRKYIKNPSEAQTTAQILRQSYEKDLSSLLDELLTRELITYENIALTYLGKLLINKGDFFVTALERARPILTALDKIYDCD